MVGLFTQLANYLSRLMSGGTLEIVLLIVIIVVGVILLLLLLWVLWKLSVALAKGLLWLGRWGTEKAKETSASRREARLAAPPKVATGWASSKRIGLRRALAQARRLADPEALRIVVIAGSGASDLCRGLSLTPPGVGTIGIAAGGDTVLVDASRADTGMLRRLAAALPWRRPVDAVAAFVEPGGIASEALSRCAAFLARSGLAHGAALRIPRRRQDRGLGDHRRAQSQRRRHLRATGRRCGPAVAVAGRARRS